MKTFKDRDGRVWELRLSIGAARQLKDGLGLDIMSAMHESSDLLMTLASDPAKLFSAIWILCEAQAARLDISEEQFADLFDADAIEQAAGALLREIADFFPLARRALHRAVDKMSKVGEAVDRIVAKRLKGLDLEQEIERRTAPPPPAPPPASGGSSKKSAASSGSAGKKQTS